MDVLIGQCRPLALDRAEILHEEASVFREQDESAHTLVPSGLSSRTPSVISKNGQRSAYGSELLDHPLTTYERLYKQNLMYFKPGVNGHTRSRQDSTPSISTIYVGEEQYNEKESIKTTVPNSLFGKCRKQRHPSSLNCAAQNLSREEHGILGSEISVGGESSGSDWAWNSQGLVWTKEKSLHICQISQGVKVVQSTHHYTLRDYVSQCEASLVEELLGLIGNGSRIWRVCLLLEACFQRRLDLVELLLKDNAIVNGVSHIGTHFLYTPLHLAVEMDFPELVRLLCVSGANVDVFSSQGYTLFNLACREDKAKAVEALIPFQNTLHPSYMLGAAESFNYDTILVLLKSGLDVNARHTIHEETSLHLLVRAALEHRCGCKTSEECRISPTLQALLDHGAQLSAQDCLGQTVYHYIAQAREPFIKKYSCLEPILAALFSCTEDVLRIKNNAPACQTPLQLVQRSGDYELRETFRRASRRKLRSPGDGFLTQSLLPYDLYTQDEVGTSLESQSEADELSIDKLSIDDLSIDELSIELTP